MTVLLFGITRDIIGTNSLSLPVEKSRDFTTVGDLRAYLKAVYPGLEALSSLAIAVNKEYAEDDQALDSFDEIALIPPVSGG
jgi:molybdopterin synthase sulfur carrier subunit